MVNIENINDELHVLFNTVAIMEQMGYDLETVGEVLNNKDLNYKDNKIEFSLVDIPDDYVTEDGSKVSGSMVKNLKFSIDKLILPDNGSKEPPAEDKQEGDKLGGTKENTEKNEKDNVTNPKTGDINMNVISLSMIGLCTLMFVGIKKLKKLK